MMKRELIALLGLLWPCTPSFAVPLTQCGSSQTYCQSSPNSYGIVATLEHQGSLVVAENSFLLHASNCIHGAPGVFFYGVFPYNVPFSDGVLCIRPPLFRLWPIVPIDTTGQASFAVDLASPPSAAGTIVAGATWHFQFWYRDPFSSGSGSNLSDGLKVQFADSGCQSTIHEVEPNNDAPAALAQGVLAQIEPGAGATIIGDMQAVASTDQVDVFLIEATGETDFQATLTPESAGSDVWVWLTQSNGVPLIPWSNPNGAGVAETIGYHFIAGQQALVVCFCLSGSTDYTLEMSGQ